MSSKVLYIGGFELPDKNAAAFRVQANAGLLAQTGCTVFFRGISKNKTVQKKFVKRDEFYHSEIKYPASIKEWIRYTFSADDVIKIIEDLNADTVICYNYPSFAMKRIIKYCHKRRINVINECTEWYSSRGMGIFRGCIKKIDTLMRIYIIPRLVDYNIVTTQYLADKIKRRSCVIPEIYTVQMPYKANETNNNEIKLIYMGTPGLKFNKDNLGMMIEILSCVDADFHFDIVGINEQDYIDNLCINENNYNKIKKQIKFWGRVEHDKCIELLSSADYTFLYRDISKISLAGFPRKISESLQYNVPVITTKTSDLSRYIINGKTGYVISFNKEKAAREVEKIIKLGSKHVDSLKRTINSNSPLLSLKFKNQICNMISTLSGEE